MKVLILGHKGYIGSYLYRHLAFNKNLQITGIDANIHHEQEWWWPFHRNCIDYKYLEKSYLKKFDVIVLLAGHSSVKMCENNMVSSFRNNVDNFVSLLDKIDKQLLIYASSSSVYGSTASKRVTENYKTYVPNNFYDLTKQVIDNYALISNKNVIGLRFGTVNGSGPVIRTDIMINSMVDSIFKDNHIKLYIKNIYRPILGIYDLSRAIETIIRTPHSYGESPQIYNLASFNMTAEQIAKKVANICMSEVKEYSSDNPLINTKIQTNAYNFCISTRKFTNKYKFKFEETPESIAKNLYDAMFKAKLISRSEPVLY